MFKSYVRNGTFNLSFENGNLLIEIPINMELQKKILQQRNKKKAKSIFLTNKAIKIYLF